MTSLNPTERFSNRVADYIKYRPDYPLPMLDYLVDTCGLTPGQVVADIGSGTGLLTRRFLEYGNPVYGVEPNAAMRSAAVTLLADYPAFSSVNGQAETTTLPDAAVSWIVAGQAFHWFDQAKAGTEFERILKPGGWVALVWNDRDDNDPFQVAYQEFLLTHCDDYRQVNHRRVTAEVLTNFFAPYPVLTPTFENTQRFDFEGLTGRLLSCSYAPTPAMASYDKTMKALRSLFDQYSQDGQLLFRYTTRLYCAQFSP